MSDLEDRYYFAHFDLLFGTGPVDNCFWGRFSRVILSENRPFFVSFKKIFVK
mgnify:CR=1 FL=1